VDVGSTAVKAVVVDEASNRVVWRDYGRCETRQSETLLAFLSLFDALVLQNLTVLARGHTRVIAGGGSLGSFIERRIKPNPSPCQPLLNDRPLGNRTTRSLPDCGHFNATETGSIPGSKKWEQITM
jgi:hypothetical protein